MPGSLRARAPCRFRWAWSESYHRRELLRLAVVNCSRPDRPSAAARAPCPRGAETRIGARQINSARDGPARPAVHAQDHEFIGTALVVDPHWRYGPTLYEGARSQPRDTFSSRARAFSTSR